MELNELLRALKGRGASDMHLVAGLAPAVRVGDELVVLHDVGRPTSEDIRNMIYPILTKEEIERFERDRYSRHEMDIARGVADIGRFRFNLYKQRGSVSVTIRPLSPDIRKLDSLGLPTAAHDFTHSQRGLVLVTGPSGSGRSTTLAAMVDDINHQRAARIMTIEDPVKYIIPSDQSYVTQREVGDSADTLSFENALRYGRRQNLDVVMVSHLASYTAMRHVLELAETGVLVLGGMLTLSAAASIARFIESFPPDQQAQANAQLSANLLGVISQILLARADRKGRVMACEVMRVNDLIRAEIRQNKFDAITPLVQSGATQGMKTLDQSLMELARRGQINYATAKPYIRDEATHRMIWQLSGSGRMGAPMPVPPPPGTRH